MRYEVNWYFLKKRVPLVLHYEYFISHILQFTIKYKQIE